MRFRLSTRPGDVGGYAGRLRTEIERQMTTSDFTEKVADADVLLVMIGPRWVRDDESSASRLLDPVDPVRLELDAALDRGTRIVPLLIRGAQLPAPEDLPERLRGLRQLNAWPISHQGFRDDVESLLTGLTRPDRKAGAAQGEIEISSPSGVLKRAERRDNNYARLAIDGQDRGMLRMHNQTRTFRAEVGTHTVTVGVGKKEQSLDVVVVAGGTVRIRADMSLWAWTPGPIIELLS